MLFRKWYQEYNTLDRQIRAVSSLINANIKMPIHVCVEGVLHIVKVGATRLFQLAQGSPFFLSCPYCSNSLLIVICTVVTITVFLAASCEDLSARVHPYKYKYKYRFTIFVCVCVL